MTSPHLLSITEPSNGKQSREGSGVEVQWERQVSDSRNYQDMGGHSLQERGCLPGASQHGAWHCLLWAVCEGPCLQFFPEFPLTYSLELRQSRSPWLTLGSPQAPRLKL